MATEIGIGVRVDTDEGKAALEGAGADLKKYGQSTDELKARLKELRAELAANQKELKGWTDQWAQGLKGGQNIVAALNQEVQKNRAEIEQTQAAIREMGTAAKNAAAVQNEATRSVMGELSDLRMLMRNVYAPVMVVGFVEMLARIPEEIRNGTDALMGYRKAAKEVEESIHAMNLKLTEPEDIGEARRKALQDSMDLEKLRTALGAEQAIPAPLTQNDPMGEARRAWEKSQSDVILKIGELEDQVQQDWKWVLQMTPKNAIEPTAAYSRFAGGNEDLFKQGARASMEEADEVQKFHEKLDRQAAEWGLKVSELAAKADEMISKGMQDSAQAGMRDVNAYLKSLQDLMIEVDRLAEKGNAENARQLMQIPGGLRMDEFKRQTRDVSEWSGTINRAFSDLSRGFASAMTNGRNFGQIMRQTATDILRTIATAEMENAIMGRPGGRSGGGGGDGQGGLGGMIAQGIGGLFKGAFTPTDSMGGVNGPSWIGGGNSDFGDNLGFPGFAAGGDFGGKMPFIAGERGPELIVPRGPGSVLPSGSFGGSRTINISVDATNADAGVEHKARAGLEAALSDAKSQAVMQALLAQQELSQRLPSH